MTRVPLKSILSEKNPALRRKFVLDFPRKDSADFYEVMSKVLKDDPSPVIRHEVAFILGTVKTPQSLALLVGIIKHDSSDLVRHEAIEAIGDIGIKSRKVSALLKQLTRDKNPFIKDTAQIALVTIKL